MTHESPYSDLTESSKTTKKSERLNKDMTFKSSFVRLNFIILQTAGRLTCQACTISSKSSILAQIMARTKLVNPAIIWNKNNWPDPVTAWLGICFVSLLTVLIVTSWGEKAERLKSIMPVSPGKAFPSEHHSWEVFRCRFPLEWHTIPASKAKGRSKEE